MTQIKVCGSNFKVCNFQISFKVSRFKDVQLLRISVPNSPSPFLRPQFSVPVSPSPNLRPRISVPNFNFGCLSLIKYMLKKAKLKRLHFCNLLFL
ncbi:MAG: hypothetical protein J6K42_03430 [Clostridia bacterium]|nr:hypothetical protein [Clostridia bacterium]